MLLVCSGFVQLFTTRPGDPLGKDAAGNIIQEAPLPVWANLRQRERFGHRNRGDQ